jgi:hypothetical protein
MDEFCGKSWDVLRRPSLMHRFTQSMVSIHAQANLRIALFFCHSCGNESDTRIRLGGARKLYRSPIPDNPSRVRLPVSSGMEENFLVCGPSRDYTPIHGPLQNRARGVFEERWAG